MKFTSNKGFTLIELLVVISIIGLLSSVVLASLSSVRQKAKNAKLVSDIKQLKIALELYRNDKGKYPNVGVPSIKLTGGSDFYGRTDTSLISYLKTELVDNKYISSISNIATFRSDYGFAPMAYATGDNWNLYNSDPLDEFYQTCGGKILKEYLLEFYSDQSLNLLKSGFIYLSYPQNFEAIYSSGAEPNTNWYCIGE